MVEMETLNEPIVQGRPNHEDQEGHGADTPQRSRIAADSARKRQSSVQMMLPKHANDECDRPTGRRTGFKWVEIEDQLIGQPSQHRSDGRGNSDTLQFALAVHPFHKRMEQSGPFRLGRLGTVFVAKNVIPSRKTGDMTSINSQSIRIISPFETSRLRQRSPMRLIFVMAVPGQPHEGHLTTAQS